MSARSAFSKLLNTKLPTGMKPLSFGGYRTFSTFALNSSLLRSPLNAQGNLRCIQSGTKMCSLITSQQLQAPQKRFLGTYIGNEESSDLITKHYESSHLPLGAKRVYGPPYTDTKPLEAMNTCYMEHRETKEISDQFAWGLVRFFRIFTHLFFRDKYGHHAVVLETVAAVPGMVAGMWRHLKSLRTMQRDHGWIGKLLEEAENERMHLLTWMQVVQPTLIERILVMLAQAFYTPCYALLYVFSPKTAHRFVGYLEEEACAAYTAFLESIDSGKIANIDAPEIAKSYWNLPPNAKLRDVVLVVRADEAMHRNVNHELGDRAAQGAH